MPIVPISTQVKNMQDFMAEHLAKPKYPCVGHLPHAFLPRRGLIRKPGVGTPTPGMDYVTASR
jgi:hypothetical protein